MQYVKSEAIAEICLQCMVKIFAMYLPFAGTVGMALLLMILPGFNDNRLFKEKLYGHFDLNNATFVDPSASGCDI